MNMSSNNIENEVINKILIDLCSNNTELFLVGGYIRDLIIDKKCYDRDYVIIGESAILFAKKVADFFQGHYVCLDEEYDIARVVLSDKKNTLDFAAGWDADIINDLKRRDYTINSMAYRIDKNGSGLLDPFCGTQDINNKIIRAISENNLIEDPLRLLRAFRLSAQLGFEIDKQTLDFISKNKELVSNISFERINIELIKLFESNHAAYNLDLMKDIKFLDEIIPELTPQRNVPPNIYHHLYLIDHSIEVVRQVELNFTDMPQWLQDRLNIELAMNIKLISLLKIAALLHDLGKPSTWQIDDIGRHRFIKHEEVGAELAVDILKRLKFSKNSIKYITKLIKYHLYPSQLLTNMVEVSEKALFKMFRKIGEETPDTILIAMADRLSAQGPEVLEGITSSNIKGLYILLEKFAESKEKVFIPPFLSGNEIMQMLNIPRGPKVGAVVKSLREAQISGEINSREEAISFVKNWR